MINGVEHLNVFWVFTISRLYETKYKADQGGVCGITCNVNWAQPRDESNADDQQASENNLQFNFGWFLHPIVLNGKYPEYMRTQVDTKSAEQGRNIKNIFVNDYRDIFIKYRFNHIIEIS